MNYYEKVAKMLGVELGEEFKVKWEKGAEFTNSKYCLTKDGFNKVGTTWFVHGILANILSGKAEIVKLPWKPKNGERYWYYSPLSRKTFYLTWEDGLDDLLLWKAGNCFKIREEAEIKGKEIMEQIAKEFEEI